MMFSTKEPRRSGIVNRIDVPLNRYLGAAWEQGVEDSAFSSVSQVTENIIYSEGNRLSAEEANKKYAVEGLNFQVPVYETVARMMRDRHQRRLDRELMLQSASTFSGRWWGGLGVGVLASFTNPLDFALNFMPIVGSEKAAASVGRGAFRQSLARGLISEEALMASRVPLPRLTGAFIEGATGQAIAEVPIRIAKEMNLEEYSLSDSFVNIAAGSIMGGAIHLGVTSAARLLRRLHPETKKVLFQQAAEQFVNGESPNVHKFVELDEAKIRERVAFDKQQAASEGALNLNESDVRETVRNQVEGPRNEMFSVSIRGREFTLLVSKNTQHGVDPLEGPYRISLFDENEVAQGHVSITPEQAEALYTGKTADGKRFDADSFLREILAEELNPVSLFGIEDEFVIKPKGRVPRTSEAFFQRPDVKDAIEVERQRRIQEFVNQRRMEYDPDKELKKEVLAEIDRQKAEGRVLHPDEASKWGFTREEMAQTDTLVKEDIETLKQELGIEDEMLKEDAPPIKPIPDNLMITVVAGQELAPGKSTKAIVQIELTKANPADNERVPIEQLKEYGVAATYDDLKVLPQGQYKAKEAFSQLGISPLTPDELSLIMKVPDAEEEMIDAAVDCLTKNIT